MFVFGGLSTPQKAEAVFVPVGDLVNLEFHAFDFLKENAIDTIAFTAAKMAAQQLVTNMVDWIGSGFDGNPSFVTNRSELFRSISDEIFIDVLTNDIQDAYTNAPFKNALVSNLATDYSNRNSLPEYTLDQVVEDDEAFLAGDFSKGGWDGWFALTQNPGNNYYGAQNAAKSKIDAETGEAIENQKAELAENQGFLSLKDDSGNVITPGSVISEQLNFNLGSGLRQLENADELGEIVTASLNALAQSAIQQGLNQVNNQINDALESVDDALDDAIGDIDQELNDIIEGAQL